MLFSYRSLGVGIKNFHVDMINQTNEDNSHEITCTLLLEGKKK
jgi:hypothetical protein